jgi:hypothetical protein
MCDILDTELRKLIHQRQQLIHSEEDDGDLSGSGFAIGREIASINRRIYEIEQINERNEKFVKMEGFIRKFLTWSTGFGKNNGILLDDLTKEAKELTK